jgi:dTDP-4-amino-4,6-dideoxygalactose transaminase
LSRSSFAPIELLNNRKIYQKDLLVKNIPFFNYPELYAERSEVYDATVRDVLRRGGYIMQKELEEFETNLASYLGCKHAIGVADGTAALVFALRVAGVRPGDEVIVSSHTFIATAAAVHHVGAQPVVCDCLPDSMMDPVSAERMISPRTKAIMPTQLNGRTCDMDRLMDICSRYGLEMVEDSCQALGARFKNKPAGLFGKVGSYSFYPAKTLGCFGDGGAVVTDSDEAAAFIRQLRDHGRNAQGKVTIWGHNGRLDNLQAAVLNVKLAQYDNAIARRRAIASIYQQRLNDLRALRLPPPPESDPRRFDIFQNYEIWADDRDQLRQFLTENGIGTILQWGGWMLHQLEDLGMRSDAPFAEIFSKHFMMLPLHHMLTDGDVHYVCDVIQRFYAQKGY